MEQETNNKFIKTFREINKLNLLYYILAFVVLFFKIFTLEADNIQGATYRIGLFEFAKDIGWIYFAVNAFGIVLSYIKPLSFLESLARKLIAPTNLVISVMVLYQTIPDTLKFRGNLFKLVGKPEIGIGFWLILGLHLLATIIFYASFIIKIKKKKKAREKAKLKEEIIKEEITIEQE